MVDPTNDEGTNVTSDSARLRRWCRASLNDSLATEYERHQIDRYFETGDPDYLPEDQRAIRDAGVVFEVRGELQLEGEPEPKEKPGSWWPIGHPLYEGPETGDHRRRRE
jgi:hypothetical protein